jgi:hypothetical protein
MKYTGPCLQRLNKNLILQSFLVIGILADTAICLINASKAAIKPIKATNGLRMLNLHFKS